MTRLMDAFKEAELESNDSLTQGLEKITKVEACRRALLLLLYPDTQLLLETNNKLVSTARKLKENAMQSDMISKQKNEELALSRTASRKEQELYSVQQNACKKVLELANLKVTECAQLRNKYNVLDSDIETLHAEIINLNKDLMNANIALQEKQMHEQSIASNSNEQAERIKRLEIACEEKQAHLAELQAKHNEATEALAIDLEKLSKANEDLNKQVHQLTLEKEDTTEQTNAAGQIHNLSKELEDKQEQISSLEARISESKSQEERNNIQMAQQAHQIHSLEQQILFVNGKCENSVVFVAKAHKQLVDLDAEYKLSLGARLMEKKEFNELSARLSESIVQKNALEFKYTEMEKDYKELSETSDNQRSQLKKENDNMLTHLQAMQANLQRSISEMKILHSEYEKMTSLYHGLLHDKMSQHDNELRLKEMEMESLRKIIEAEASENALLATKYENETTSGIKLEEDMAMHQKHLAGAVQTIKQQLSDAADMQRYNADYIRILWAHRTKTEVCVNKLSSIIGSLSTILNSTSESHSCVQVERDDLLNKLADAVNELKSVNGKYAQMTHKAEIENECRVKAFSQLENTVDSSNGLMSTHRISMQSLLNIVARQIAERSVLIASVVKAKKVISKQRELLARTEKALGAKLTSINQEYSAVLVKAKNKITYLNVSQMSDIGLVKDMFEDRLSRTMNESTLMVTAESHQKNLLRFKLEECVGHLCRFQDTVGRALCTLKTSNNRFAGTLKVQKANLVGLEGHLDEWRRNWMQISSANDDLRGICQEREDHVGLLQSALVRFKQNYILLFEAYRGQRAKNTQLRSQLRTMTCRHSELYIQELERRVGVMSGQLVEANEQNVCMMELLKVKLCQDIHGRVTGRQAKDEVRLLRQLAL